ncbi:MAG: hypothetical protein OQJ89_09685 [Kangiellaceae bacterium]|nr:hypothetical protein [Kangiellaceae bacterium]MCW9017225.1 hypothetical protein [Kangiellaceae bacterium]
MHKSILATMVAMGFAGSVAASDVTVADNVLQMHSSLYGNKVNVTVMGPDGFVFNTTRAGGDSSLTASDMKATKDGLYKFEFVEIKEFGEEQVQDDFNGRGLATRKVVESKTVSGHFRIKDGAMVDSNLAETKKDSVSLNK